MSDADTSDLEPGPRARALHPESLWQRTATPEEMNRRCRGTMVEHLGIEITACDHDSVTATMPVDGRTIQPLGLLHGGATAALIETVGSVAGALAVQEGYVTVGLDINATHVKSVREGLVTATARAKRIGRRVQSWQVDVVDAEGQLVSTGRITMAVIPERR